VSATNQLAASPRKLASKLASGVSDTLGPLPPLAALCTAGALHTAVLAGVGWGLLAMFFSAILPYLVTWKMRHPAGGARPGRRARAIYMGLAVLTAAVGVAVLIPLGSPAAVVDVTVTIIVCLVVVVVPNARWRWSNHMAACAAGCAMLVVLAGTAGLLAVAALPAVAWARLRLERHTLAELVGGGVLGAVVAAVMLPVFLHLG
jgi:hypothetical protein